MYKEVQVINFPIIENVYPALNNYRFILNIPGIRNNIVIVEQWATGNLYVSIEGTNYQIPLRFNTNLLPSTITDKKLIYDYDRQSFIYYSK